MWGCGGLGSGLDLTAIGIEEAIPAAIRERQEGRPLHSEGIIAGSRRHDQAGLKGSFSDGRRGFRQGGLGAGPKFGSVIYHLQPGGGRGAN